MMSTLVRGGALMALVAVALLASACDDAIEIDQKDVRFSIRTSGAELCPDPGGTAEARIVVSVFGPNGDVQEGTLVTFETTAGSLDVDRDRTDRRGRVDTTVAAPRTPTFTVTADVKNVGSDSVDFFAPPPQELRGPLNELVFTADEGATEVEIPLTVVVVNPCQVGEVAFRLNFDAANLEFVRIDLFDDTTALLNSGGTATAVPGPGYVDVVLTRDAGTGGYSGLGAQRATDVVFRATASSLSSFSLQNVSILDPLAVPYDVFIGPFSDVEVVFP